ncbi:hypothetical protein [Bradyrhizobium retamae]|nr:hypothetical protein [Bradyrhizobium retamae]
MKVVEEPVRHSSARRVVLDRVYTKRPLRLIAIAIRQDMLEDA